MLKCFVYSDSFRTESRPGTGTFQDFRAASRTGAAFRRRWRAEARRRPLSRSRAERSQLDSRRYRCRVRTTSGEPETSNCRRARLPVFRVTPYRRRSTRRRSRPITRQRPDRDTVVRSSDRPPGLVPLGFENYRVPRLYVRGDMRYVLERDFVAYSRIDVADDSTTDPRLDPVLVDSPSIVQEVKRGFHVRADVRRHRDVRRTHRRLGLGFDNGLREKRHSDGLFGNRVRQIPSTVSAEFGWHSGRSDDSENMALFRRSKPGG